MIIPQRIWIFYVNHSQAKKDDITHTASPGSQLTVDLDF